MNNPVRFGSYPVGREVENRFGDVPGARQRHLEANARTLAQARRCFREASLSDFEIRGVGQRVWVHRQSGEHYRRDESDPLALADPSKSGVACFVVGAGNKIHYLYRRGVEPAESTYIGDAPVAEEIRATW